MTTTIAARKLTADHHGCHIQLDRGHYWPLAGTLTDTLIGDQAVTITIDGQPHQVPADVPVHLRRVS